MLDELLHAILTPVGSAGDVNPFVVIGAELRRRGHRVTLIASEPFAGAAAAANLEFVQLGTAEDFDRTTRDPNLWHPRHGVATIMKAVVPRLREAYATLERVYEPGESILVGHGLSFATRMLEETQRAPGVTLHLAPIVFRSDFRPPRLPEAPDMTRWPRWSKRIVWWVADHIMLDPLIAPPLNAWRKELGLPPISRVFKTWLHSPQRLIGLFPDWFGDPQPDWPSHLRLAGFVLSDATCAPARERTAGDAALDRFLASGDRPVLFTPGSANRHGAAFFEAAIDATARLGRRALFVTGYREQLRATLPPHVHHAEYAVFASVFPRAAAVVHHGGIGTCAQGLAAGVPQLIMPLGFDQPDNGSRLQHLGVAEMLPPKQFTGPNVAAALSRLTASDAVRSACARWRAQVDEAGAKKRACDLIEEQYGLAGAPIA